MSNLAASAKNVVVVSSDRAHVDADKMAMRWSDFKLTKFFESGEAALQALPTENCQVVICDHHINDMDALSFLRRAKSLSDTNLQIVMVTEVNDKKAVLDAIASGCSGYIIRPYSKETFERHMLTAWQLHNFALTEVKQVENAKMMNTLGQYDKAIEELEEVISIEDNSQKYYELGCKYLVREKYGKAIVAFQKAVRTNNLFAEAYQGLSDAFKGKGDLGQCQMFLNKAIEVFAELNRLEKVKELFIDILKYDHKASNPLNALGIRLRKEGDYKGAIRAYKQAIDLTPDDENIHFNLAKAYYFRKEYNDALESVTRALILNPDLGEALSMYERIKKKPWTGTSIGGGRGHLQDAASLDDGSGDSEVFE